MTNEQMEAEIKRLRSAIETYLNGNYATTRKYDKCKHGHFGFDTCEACIDEYFVKVLSE